MEALKANSIKYSFVFFILSLLLCKSLQGQILPYKNPDLKVEDRVNDLIKRMTIEEKVPAEVLDKLFNGQSIGCLDSPSIDLEDIAIISKSADQYLRKNTRLGIPAIQPELIRALYKTGKQIVLVMIHRRAYSIKWEKEHIPAILEAWYPGEEGGNAVASYCELCN